MGLWAILKGEQPDPIEMIIHQFKHGSDKGEFGEYLTEYAINSLDGAYFVLKNLYIPYKDRTSEIDVLLCHEQGIFVFESKNYSGWIFGKETDRFWTQSLNKKEKNRFYNPILQNKTHIKALSDFLNLRPEIPIISCIIFSERCELKTTFPASSNLMICKRNELLKHLKTKMKNLPVTLSIEELRTLKTKLLECTGKSVQEKQEHIEKLKK